MKKHNYIKYFRVFKHDTAVTEISANDFRPVIPQQLRMAATANNLQDALCDMPGNPYRLPADNEMFYGYLTLGKAMREAKHGAQRHIYRLTLMAEAGLEQLKQYRIDH